MKTLSKIVAVASLAAASYTQAEVTVNAAVSNNYLWRGLTQTINEPAISGGIDYSAESGFYAGTWTSNVQYSEVGGDFSYEHDLYLGYAGEAGAISYDVGYLYVNYNEDTKFDFSEVYGSIGIADFSATVYLLAHTEPDEADYLGEGGGTADFGFASAYYISLDYGVELGDGFSLGLHLGFHEGDFVEVFNFGDGETYSYMDYNVSLSKEAFSFTVSQTDVEEDPASPLNNDDMKFVVAYSFEL